MTKLLPTILLLSVCLVSRGQYSLDTVYKAKAWTNTAIDMPFSGKTSGGHVYHAMLLNNYDGNGGALAMSIARIDLTDNSVTYKTLPGTLSSAAAFWGYVYDSLGNFYVGLNYSSRLIFKFNFKDSIWFKSLGNGFENSGSLAYSMTLGTDKNVYFGASSGDPYVSYYNPYTDSLYQYDPLNTAGIDYVLSVSGDANYIYAASGQKDSCNFWSVRKSDGLKRNILKIPATQRFNIETRRAGVYVFDPYTNQNFKMVNGDTTTPSGGDVSGSRVRYYETNYNGDGPSPTVTENYNNVTSVLAINDGTSHNISIASSSVQINIRRLFENNRDTSGVYYVGDYYGGWYNYLPDTGTLMGSTGYNVYSVLKYNDSIYYAGFYPDGTLLQWNRNQPWTVVTTPSSTTNQEFITHFRSDTRAGFHHVQGLVKYKRFIVAAGDVIRVTNTVSIAAYDTQNDTAYGYDYAGINALNFSSLVNWHNKVLMSTNGTGAKIYVYNPATNTMTDSLTFGSLTDYGSLYIQGDILVGVTPTQVYKYNLEKKQLLQQSAVTITASYQLSDGYVIIEATGTPPAYIGDFIKIPYGYTYIAESNNKLYTADGHNIVKINGVRGDNSYPINTPFNRYKHLKRVLNIN